MTHNRKLSAYSPESSTSLTQASNSRHRRRRAIPPHHTKRYYNDNEISKTKFLEDKVYKEDDDGEEAEEEDDDEEGLYTDNSAAYNDSEIVTETPMNQSEVGSTAEVVSLNSISNSASTYLNIAPLPMFQGGPDECPIMHLSRFTKVCRANNAYSVEMMMRIFPVTLDNEAALWYDLEIEPYPSLTWEEIKSAFLKVYRKTEFIDQFRSELMMFRQCENESVHAYFLRMQWILRKWPDHGVPDGVLKAIFVDGLKDDFQDWIDPQKPNSLTEALRLALAWEHAKCIRNARAEKNMVEVIKCGFCEEMHEERVCEVREKLKELWLRNRDKQIKASSEDRDTDGGVKKELVRSESGRTSRLGEEEDGKEEGERGEGVLGWKKKSQCQCWKHQCWKKTMDRNNSLVSRTSKAD